MSNTNKILLADVADTPAGRATLEKKKKEFKGKNDPPYSFTTTRTNGRVKLYAVIPVKENKKKADDGSRGLFF